LRPWDPDIGKYISKVMGGPSSAKVELELYPKSPYNAIYIDSDLTVTICMGNSLDMAKLLSFV
jgi:hypothetical protein